MTVLLQAVGLLISVGLLVLALSPLAAAVEIARTDRAKFDVLGESKSRWLLIALLGWVPGTVAYATTIRRQLAD